MSDNRADTWVEIDRVTGRSEAEQRALVLVAAGIDCQIAPSVHGTRLLVGAADVARARSELEAYDRETRQAAVQPPPLRSWREGLPGAIVYCCALFFVYGAASRQLLSRDWLSAGEAQAGLIVGGEWWRCLTALGLHADYGHLFSNMVAGAFLGILLSQILGGGLAWLLILVAGAAGNGLNALLQPAGHTSIGASTAVFGALGLLVVLMSRYRWRLWRRGLRRWLPIAAGVMLLAFLGMEGERIDVGAHIAGFVVGGLLGGLLLILGERPTRQREFVQLALGGAALVVFVASWLFALA